MSDTLCDVCDTLSADALAALDADTGHRDDVAKRHSVSARKLRAHRQHRVAEGHIPKNRPGWNQPKPNSLAGALALEPLPIMQAPKVTAPRGSEPGIRWTPGGTDAIVTMPPQEKVAGTDACSDYLRSIGFDPDLYDVHPVEATMNAGAWHRRAEDAGIKHSAYTDPQNPTWLCKFRITIRQDAQDGFDLEALVQAAGECVTRTPPPATITFGETLLVILADWQTGKRDKGGTEALIERVVALGPAILKRVAELELLGRHIERIVLAGLGDLVEGCAGFYPMQTFSVELDRREQLRVTRRLLVELIKVVATLGIPMTVTGVAGNHGESRNGAGKAFTTPGDNDDLAVLEQVAEVFALASGYDHVAFVIPDQQLSHTLDLSGRHTVFSHGHVGSGGWKGLWTWFKEQRAHARTSATLFVCGHYHHLHYEEDGLLAILQAMALEGGSDYWAERHGSEAKPGTTTCLVSSHGLRDLQGL